MTEFIENIFSSIFGNNVILATILIAVVPIIELKGAIPFSMSSQIWGTNALSLVSAFLYGLLGSCLVVPILALIYTPIINWLKKTKLFKKLAEITGTHTHICRCHIQGDTTLDIAVYIVEDLL